MVFTAADGEHYTVRKGRFTTLLLVCKQCDPDLTLSQIAVSLSNNTIETHRIHAAKDGSSELQLSLALPGHAAPIR